MGVGGFGCGGDVCGKVEALMFVLGKVGFPCGALCKFRSQGEDRMRLVNHLRFIPKSKETKSLQAMHGLECFS